jgi:pimeloyl-ACP methyl ester carboxylesterase
VKSLSYYNYSKLTFSLLLVLVISIPFSSSALELNKHYIESAGHQLVVWSKQPSGKDKPGKHILLLHGRTWSALPDFDLQVPGESLSLMDNLVAKGFKVWALDARGYGATSRDETGWNNPNKAAKDVANVVRWIERNSGIKPTIFGWSYGSMVAQLAVQQNKELVKGVILFGYPIDPEKVIEPIRSPVVAPAKANTAENAASDFITPGTISQQAIDTYVKESLEADPFRADWNKLEQWNQLDATEVHVPVLLLQAEFDPLADTDSHARFFKKLPNANKQWVVLSNSDHAALLETAKDRLVYSVNSFVEWLSH